jgi:hypothetical protein
MPANTWERHWLLWEEGEYLIFMENTVLEELQTFSINHCIEFSISAIHGIRGFEHCAKENKLGISSDNCLDVK